MCLRSGHDRSRSARFVLVLLIIIPPRVQIATSTCSRDGRVIIIAGKKFIQLPAGAKYGRVFMGGESTRQAVFCTGALRYLASAQ
jgi:hypothetical protein